MASNPLVASNYKNTNNPRPSTSQDSSDFSDALKCKKCNKIYELPVYMCEYGHSICRNCTPSAGSHCLICYGNITDKRNTVLEEILNKIVSVCPYKLLGCHFTGSTEKIKFHMNGCQFQQYCCPMKKFDNSCDWKGNISNLVDHFKGAHSNFMVLKPSQQVTFQNINLNMDDKNIQLFIYNKLLFVYYVIINTQTQTANWIIQAIGRDVNISNWLFEIHIYNVNQSWRKVTFVEDCISYDENHEEIIRKGKCASIPLKVLRNYLNKGDLTFKFYMRDKTAKKDVQPMRPHYNNRN